MKFRLSAALVLSCLALLGHTSSPEERGLEIAQEYDRRDLGFGDYAADMEMVLINTHGDKSVRMIRAKTLEMENDGESERRLLIFDRPRDVKGTVLLTSSKKTNIDDQWLYFPAIKRVKRISSKNKSGPFMGSEFSYEDFGAPEVDKYTYRYLRNEPCVGGDCFVFERYPNDKNSGYSKQILWVDTEDYRLFKVDFYDRKKSLIKSLSVSGYKQYLGKYWRAEKMHMHNVQNGKQTILHWRNYEFSLGLSLIEFQPNNLRSLR